MGLLGAGIGAALKIGGSIIGGHKASKLMKQVRNNINGQLQDNQNWYDRNYNKDATQRADAQRALTMTEESIRNRNRQAAGSQAVMGGTDESTAAAKEANNQALATTTAAIAANADQRKDAIDAQYRSTNSSLNNSLNELNTKNAAEIAQAAQGVGDAAASFAGQLDKSKVTPTVGTGTMAQNLLNKNNKGGLV